MARAIPTGGATAQTGCDDEMADPTPKQEAFALAFLETGNAAEAYRRAYDVAPDAKDSWIYVEACQLLDHPKVALRLKELRDQAEVLSIFTLQAAMEEFEEARQTALRAGQAAAAVSATSGKVKLFGLDRPAKVALAAEHTGKDGGPMQFMIQRTIVDPHG
jgi:phage terminase small subunit